MTLALQRATPNVTALLAVHQQGFVRQAACAALAVLSAYMLGKESLRAGTGGGRGGRVVRATLVAVEAVVGLIDEHLDIRVLLLEGLDRLQRNPVVLVAKVRHGQALAGAPLPRAWSCHRRSK